MHHSVILFNSATLPLRSCKGLFTWRLSVSLTANQTKMAAGRSGTNQGNNGRTFRLAIPQANYSDNSAERFLLTLVKITEVPKLHFFFASVSRHF